MIMLSLFALGAAFTLPSHQLLRPTGLRAHDAPQMMLNSRREALLAAGAACLVGLPAVQPAAAEEFKSKTGKIVPYTKLKSGPETGGTPKIGDLVAIRFKGSVKATGAVFDDILNSAEPYYMRLGRLRTRATPHQHAAASPSAPVRSSSVPQPSHCPLGPSTMPQPPSWC